MVVLPAPEGPTIAVMVRSWAWAVKLIWSRTVWFS